MVSKKDSLLYSKKTKTIALFFIITTIISSMAHSNHDNRSDFGVSFGVGSLGANAQAFYRLNDYFSVRGTVHSLSLTQTVQQNELDFDVTSEGNSYSGGLDFYPFKESFRIFGGYINYGNQFDIEAVPENGILELNGEKYDTSTELKRVSGSVVTPTDAGYFGIGWGNPTLAGKSLGFMFDLGVILLSESTVDLEAECFDNSVICHSVQTNLEEERYELQNQVSDNYLGWPYITMALSYQF